MSSLGYAGSLDTNVLLRLILNDIPEQHRAAVKLFRTAQSNFLVSDTAIVEIVFVLSGSRYQLSRPQIADAILGLFGTQKIDSNQELFKKVIGLFIAHPKLSFEDCYLAVSAEYNNAEPLWTFDKKLATQAPVAHLVNLN